MEPIPEKRMVPGMVIIVPNQDIVHHAPEELGVVFLGAFPVASQEARQVQIGCQSALGLMELQRRQAAYHEASTNAVLCFQTIKSLYQQDVLAKGLNQPRDGHMAKLCVAGPGDPIHGG